MKKSLFTFALALFICTQLRAQSVKTDTVIIELAKTSKVVFTIRDKSDLPTLKAYDYQALFRDILAKIEAKDSSASMLSSNTLPAENTVKEDWPRYETDDYDTNDDDDYDSYSVKRKGYSKGTRYRGHRSQSYFNFDLGMNNILSDGKFPDEDDAPYTVRPWGSWYVGINSIQKIKVAGSFFTELGLGISWYNFKFQNDGLILSKGVSEIEFSESGPEIDPTKSKLTVCYLNASIIPVLDFGSRGRKSRFWGHTDAFRIGFGPYAGYRIQSYAKQVYEVDGNKEKDRTRSNFYLNNVRYGARFQVGYRGTDIFVNYDMNELFAENKGPKLNAFSFGVIF